MTSKERMIVAMSNGTPDRVPVAPDMSNMIPCRLTGKPFWDIYLYQSPPLWKAYIAAVKRFGFDGWLPLYEGIIAQEDIDGNVYIVEETSERIVTRRMERVLGQERWDPMVTVYPRDNPPTRTKAVKLGIGERSARYRPVEGAPRRNTIPEIIETVRSELGDLGAVGFNVWVPMLANPDEIYEYFDSHDAVMARVHEAQESAPERVRQAIAYRPDFIFMGYSGGLTFQSPEILREVALPTIQIITSMAKAAGIPSQMHCCGRSRALVEILANETDMSSLNPLEPAPMGDADMAEVKRRFGGKLSLMGNLHTTEVMLRGSYKTVLEASRRAIEDAAEGGGFILSTGDQCGRDTPDENIQAMIDAVELYGKYL